MRDLSRRRVAWLGLACVAVPGLVACADGTTATPLLRLAPSALGRSLALEQSIAIEAADRQHSMHALVEVDPVAVRLALLFAGRTGVSLVWDGHRMQQQQAPWWPEAVSAERVLSDLQLAWWPAQAIQAALPEGWSLVDDGDAGGGRRTLRRAGVVVVEVRHPDAARTVLEHRGLGYRVTIESRPLEPAE